MQVQNPPRPDGWPFGFQKLPVGSGVLRNDINFFIVLFFLVFYSIYLKGSVFCTVNLQ